MKVLLHFARFFTGLLFIFSGMVKLNDPSGFAIKLNEYFDVFAEDVSTRQDSLVLSIKEGAAEVSRKAFQLYSFDKERTFSLSSSTDTESDTSGKVTGYTVHVNAYLGSESAGELEFRLPDSASIGMFTVKASVLNNVALQSDFKVRPNENLSASKPVDLSKFAKTESALYDFFKWLKKFSLWFSVFFCALEVILGFALIVGWRMRLTAWLLLLIILFFTFLTGYSAWFKKVTDCGCFGDFIKLKPWTSFYKDLVLTFLIVIIFIGRNKITPWFSKGFGWKFISVISLLCLGFGIYCYMFLPVWDFLPYKEGSNIKHTMTYLPPGQLAHDSVEMSYVFHKGKDSAIVPYVKPYTEYTKYTEKGWEPGRRIDKVLVEGYNWPIHDFAISDAATGQDLKDSFLNAKTYQLVWVCTYLGEGYDGANKDIARLYDWAKKNKVAFFPLTASAGTPADEYARKHKLPFRFMSADNKMLMTMGRFNPTLYFMKGTTILEKRSGLNMPSNARLEKLMK
ncbi:MAG: hypothetical protein JNL57_09260 [Bacteroidetes bacterium]|nr:hypothetical protein [Bacteroidota bacterium]